MVGEGFVFNHRCLVSLPLPLPLSLSLQELECLQDHLEDLMPACREVVGNLTELESEVLAHRGLLPDLPLNSSRCGCHSRAPASGDCWASVVLKRTSVC